MALQLQTPPTLYPLTVAEAKSHLRVDVADDDALIQALISASTQDAEHLMGRAIMPQKWLYTADVFDAEIELDRPTVTAVDYVKYIHPTTGVPTTLSAGVYQTVLLSDHKAKILPAYGQTWPGTRAQPEAVQILFSCGYPDAASVPELIKAWIKLRLGMLYENRVAAGDKNAYAMPFVDGLLDRYRNWSM